METPHAGTPLRPHKHCNTELKPDATACTARGLLRLEPYTDGTMGRGDPSGLSKTLVGAAVGSHQNRLTFSAAAAAAGSGKGNE